MPVTVPIVSENDMLFVPARGYVSRSFEVTPDMTDATVTGHFQAAGGRGNDIQAVLATEEDFQNFINGHPSRVYYTTGQTTTGSLNVRLGPGKYVLGFSNRFALFSPKSVTSNVALTYTHTVRAPE